MDIVLLSPDNWQIYKQIRLEALQSDPQAFGSSYEKESQFTDLQWQERPSNPKSHIFVAMDADKPVGMLGILEKGPEAHLWGMYVGSAYRGQGIGKILLRAVIEKAKNLPHISKITMDVNPQQVIAVHLYKTLGFVVYGTKMYLMGDGRKYKLLMMVLKD